MNDSHLPGIFHPNAADLQNKHIAEREFDVPMTLLKHHLGLPQTEHIDPAVAKQIQDAISWCRRHVRPWTWTRKVDIRDICGETIRLDQDMTLTSSLLARGLLRADAQALLIMAVSLGTTCEDEANVDDRIRHLWQQDQPDESFCLSAYCSGLVEHCRRMAIDCLREHRREKRIELLPHYSPGYEGWDLADQTQLYQILSDTDLPLTLLESGGLEPAKSTLLVIAMTHRQDLGLPRDDYWSSLLAAGQLTIQPTTQPTETPSYAFPEKTLRKWSQKYLNIVREDHDGYRVTFRYHGTTCTNLGLKLLFDYEIKLHRDAQNRLHIGDCSCRPAEHAPGHQSMCAFLDQPEAFLTSVRETRPYRGRPLDDVLCWDGETAPSGCLCTPGNRQHKWKIVLQTLHYTMAHSIHKGEPTS